jgi:hypothetical protein
MANFNIDYLVVAGGASGANQHGGGGGAGGLRTSYGSTSGGGASAEPTLSLTTGTSYSLTVGDGGAGVTWVGANLAGNNGYDSVFNNITSIGGGGGSSYATQTIPSSGGSGGGGGSQAVGAQTGASGEPGQGYAGGSGFTGGTPYPGGGGGGAGGLGGNATTGVGGNGGDGLQNDITVTTTGTGPYYAGGGGSATYGSGTPGTGGSGIGGAGKYTNSNGNPGNPQTGSGGGGTNGGFPSGSGGSGIVVLRYPTADVASYTATGLTPTETTDGVDTVLSFTTVGTGTITFTSSTPTGTISTGEMIFNSDTDKVEYWDGTKWYGITYEVTGESPYNNVLYTGSGDTTNGQSITGIGFKPDLVWFKSTGTTYNNVLYDSIRGTNAAISTNLSTGIYSNYNRLQSFDNDGFTIKANNTADLWKIDRSGQPFVAWCFKAGGAPVTNTDGNITVNVSANPNAGFSIVTGNVGSGAKTFGTGLNQAPELVIGIPLVASTGGWAVWFKDWTTYQYAQINTSAARITAGADLWNLSNWNTSGLMGVTSSLWGTNSNFVHYCFHSVDGYSKVGSYVGNGSTTGPIVDLGFEPAWLMFKCVTQSGNWIIIDNKRATSNPRTPHLRANSSAQNDTGANEYVDFTSNGFQPKGVSNYNNNSNNQTYIYMAFV